jgi:hypothetical protein
VENITALFGTNQCFTLKNKEYMTITAFVGTVVENY